MTLATLELLTKAALACLLCQCMSLNTTMSCYESDGNPYGVDYRSESNSSYCGKYGICSCYSWEDNYSMNCSHRGLRNVWNGLIPVNVTTIYLTDNDLAELQQNTFRNLFDLTDIQLSDNKLSTLPRSLVFTNINLLILNLSSNRLSCLPTEVFSKLSNLKNLYLDHNWFTELPSHVFFGLSKLKYLKLSGNKLAAVPEDLFEQNTDVEVLRIDNNALQSVPALIFRHLVGVKTINLAGNNLKVLNDTTFSSTRSLIYLDLDRNSLTGLPANIFRNLGKMTVLYISNNKLTALPTTLFQNMFNLKVLDLSNNKLIQIQEGLFHHVNSLYLLYLSNNKIKTLSENFFDGVTNIGYLSLYGNNLASLPDGLFNKTDLSFILDLSDNKLRSIPQRLFNTKSEGHGLQILLLQKNKLTHLQNNTFNGLSRLRSLFLSNNPIDTIEDNAFVGTDLKTVFVHCDQLTRLPMSSQGRIHCVTPKENQNVTVSGKLSRKLVESFRKQGFRCEPGIDNFTCFACMLGTYGDGNGNCLPCPKGGFYQDEIGSMDCKQCNDGSFVKHGAGKSPLDCTVCPGGTDQERPAGHRGCICKSNYTRLDRFESCSLCTLEGLNCSEDYMTILPGYYWNWSFPNTNGYAYLAFVENLQIKSNEYPTNTIRYNYSMPMVIKCLRHASCVSNDTLPIHDDGCTEGYRGWLCSKCQREYYSILDVCYQCPSPTNSILLLVAVLLFCLALLSVVVWTKNTSNTSNRTGTDKLYARIKIVLGFYQVTGDLFESFSNVQQSVLLNIFEHLASITDFFEIIVRPQCINEHFEMNPLLRFKILLIFPIVLIVLTTFAYLCCRVYFWVCFNVSRSRKLKSIRSRIITFVIVTIFVTYTPTCNSIFTLYSAACTKYHIYSEGNETISLLRADHDISCDDLTLYHIAAYVATVCYVIAFPCVLFLILWNYKSNSKEDTDRETPISCNVSEESQPLLGVQPQPDDESPIWFNFLSENYRKQFWYWEVIELARKVTQTVLVTLLGWRNSLTRLLTIGLSVLFLTVHIKYCPMKNGFEHRLQVFSLAAIFLNTLVSSVQMDPDYSWIVYIGLAVIDMFIIVIVAAEALIPFIKYLTRLVVRCYKGKMIDQPQSDDDLST